MALTRAQLDQAGCSQPNCGHDHSKLSLASACHIRAGIEAVYVKASGTLEITCAHCHAPVAAIAVAP